MSYGNINLFYFNENLLFIYFKIIKKINYFKNIEVSMYSKYLLKMLAYDNWFRYIIMRAIIIMIWKL